MSNIYNSQFTVYSLQFTHKTRKIKLILLILVLIIYDLV